MLSAHLMKHCRSHGLLIECVCDVGQVDRLLLADSGTLLLCCLDPQGQLQKFRQHLLQALPGIMQDCLAASDMQQLGGRSHDSGCCCCSSCFLIWQFMITTDEPQGLLIHPVFLREGSLVRMPRAGCQGLHPFS